MKKYFIFILVINVNAAISYVLNPVEGADGYIQALNFDSQGNIYVATREKSLNHSIHKLSPGRELLWTIDIPSDTAFTSEILVNNQDDVYFYFVAPDPVLNLGVLKAQSTAIQQVDRVNSLFFLDNDGNLFYGKNPGVRVLRPNSTVPVPVGNLENFESSSTEPGVVDGDGNVYFGVRDENYKFSIALVTKESLEEDVPRARLFKDVMDNGSQFVERLFVDEENHFWLFLNDYTNRKTTIKKLINGSFENILIDGDHPDMDGIPGKDKIYVVGYNYWHKAIGTIFYITLDNEIVGIPELQNLTVQQYFTPRFLSDDEGYVYIHTDLELTPELGSMVVFRPYESHPIPIGLNSTYLPIVDHLFLDHNNDIWLIPRTSEVYFLKKGETEYVKIQNFTGICHDVKSNFITKEVFVSCNSGLYVAENER